MKKNQYWKEVKLKVNPQKVVIEVIHQTHVKHLYYPISMYE